MRLVFVQVNEQQQLPARNIFSYKGWKKKAVFLQERYDGLPVLSLNFIQSTCFVHTRGWLVIISRSLPELSNSADTQ